MGRGGCNTGTGAISPDLGWIWASGETPVLEAVCPSFILPLPRSVTRPYWEIRKKGEVRRRWEGFKLPDSVPSRGWREVDLEAFHFFSPGFSISLGRRASRISESLSRPVFLGHCIKDRCGGERENRRETKTIAPSSSPSGFLTPALI